MVHILSSLFFAASAAAAVLNVPVPDAVIAARAVPSSLPKDISFTTSGSGCTSSSGSVTRTGSYSAGQIFTISGFSTSSTSNCEIHLTSSGASAGWQVSISKIKIAGTATVNSGSHITILTQIFWSDDAADTQTLSTTITKSGTVNAVQDGTASPVWSQCIGSSGDTGILNANVRVAVTSGGGSFTLKSEEWDFAWRQC